MPPRGFHRKAVSEKLQAVISRSRSTSPAPASKAESAGAKQSQSSVYLDKDLPALSLAAVPRATTTTVPIPEKSKGPTSHGKPTVGEKSLAPIAQDHVSHQTSSSTTPAQKTASQIGVGTVTKDSPRESKDDASMPTDLWDAAYESLQKDEPKVVEAYEQFVFDRRLERSLARASLANISTMSGAERQKQLKQVLDLQQEVYREKRWEFSVGGKNIVVHEEVDRITRAVIWANSVINNVASNEPHAALAWAGVSLLLPLLLNPAKQDEDAIKGLDRICTVLLRYRVLERAYLIDDGAKQKRQQHLEELHSHLRKNTVKLYRQILGYQFRLAAHYCRKSGSRYLHNVFLSDNWKELLDEINASVIVGDDDLKLLDRELDLGARDAIEALSKAQDTRLGEIRRQLEEDRSVQQLDKANNWLNELYKNDVDIINSIHNANLEKRQNVETGKWFIDEIRSWLKEDGKMVYWRRSIPGVGKTMLMCSAIDYIKSNVTDLGLDGVAYVYFQWDQQTSQTKSAIYTSILQKIRGSADNLSTSLQKLYKKHSTINTKPSADELAKLLIDHKRDSSPLIGSTKPRGRVLLMFDALDEASVEIRTALTILLNSLDQDIFRVVITSREDLDVSTKGNMTRVDKITAKSTDIDLFLAARLCELRNDLKKRKNYHLIRDLVVDIRENAQGIFLRASLRADTVGKLQTEDEMREAAKQPFGELTEMYSKTFGQIKSHNKESSHIIKVLGWLTFAKRTLQIDELMEALAVQRQASSSIQLTKHSVPTPMVIVRRCRGLVTLDDSSGIMRLAHQTIQEYLKDLDEIQESMVDISRACFSGLTLRRRSDWLAEDEEFKFHDTKDQVLSTVDDEATEEDEEWDVAELVKSLGSRSSGNTTNTTSSNFWLDTDDDIDELDAYDTTISGAEDGEDGESAFGSTLQAPLLQFDDESSIKSGDSTDRDPIEACFVFGTGFELDIWAKQSGPFAEYAGRFAVSHFAQLTDPPEIVLEALWKFVTERPSAQLFPMLLKGDNAYPAEFTSLHMAAVVGDLITCKRLLQQGIDVNVQDTSGSTPLICAARNSHISLIEMLLDNGSDCSVRYWDGLVAFQTLVMDVPEQVFRRMIPDDFVFERSTLSFALERSLHNLVKLILEAKALDIDAMDTSGNTALTTASESGDVEAIRLLLNGGANIHQSNDGGWTCLHCAARNGHVKAVKFLLRMNADPHRMNKSLETPLLEAIEGLVGGRYQETQENDVVLIVYLLLRRKVSTTVKNFWGGTALHIAATTGSVKLVDLLLKAGCELHALQNGGETPFHMALHSNPIPEFIDVFIKAEVRLAAKLGDPRSVAYRGKNREGNTPLHMAAQSQSHEVVFQLLRLPGTQIDDRDFAGRTAIYNTMHPRGAEVFNTLLQAGASTDVIDFSDMTLLDSAIGLAPTPVISALVQRSCPSHFPWDHDSDTIQTYANESWYPQLIALLPTSTRDDPLAKCKHIYSFRDDEIAVYETTSVDEPYLEIALPDAASTVVRQVKFQIVSHDQGYSHEEDKFGGTYMNSHTWFEARIKSKLHQPADTAPANSESTTREIQINVHAAWDWRTHVKTWGFKSQEPGTHAWLAMLKPGDGILVFARARYPGWVNFVRSVRVDVYYEA